ncbi:MAG: ABC transporter substrate-binding protein [Kiloniellales bacterium]|nr:ABC transporter substrate-binding protein [Kiloniellales bacterium]
MTESKKSSRRQLIKTAGSAALTAGLAPAILAPRQARGSSRRTLKILQWNHFVPEFDRWFNEVYVKDWGRRNDTEVIVDNVGMTSLNSRAAAEVAAQKGHDLCMFLSPPPSYEEHVIDHREIYEECERRYGKPVELAVKSTYNPKTDKYYGFSDSYVPDPVNYRKDLWDDVGMYPDSWDDIRVGGRKIKKRHGIPVGLGLAPELDTNMALRSLMASFGSSIQDESGNLALNSRETLESLKFAKALYQEAMTDEVFTWDPSSNNRQMLASRGSLAVNAISITRTGENQSIPVADRIWLAKAARGPVRRIGLHHLIDVYVIWKFADNIEGAQQFLVDYIGHSGEVFRASQFYNFPCFPRMVPDLPDLIANDPKANPADKYKVFEDVSRWVTNLGYPGFANAAEDEIFTSWLISTMFAQAARGDMSPEDALSQCNREAERIFRKWRERGAV